MSFWRDEVIDFALDHETRLHMDEHRTPSPTMRWRSFTASAARPIMRWR